MPERKEERRKFPLGNAAKGEAEALVELLPAVYYLANRILDEASSAYSRKVLVALWMISSSKQEDQFGTYITTSEMVALFRDWFVASDFSVRSEVSKVKRDLFYLGFIKIEGGHDHIHLSSSGEEASTSAISRVVASVKPLLADLKIDEQRSLVGVMQRILSRVRGPASPEELIISDPK